MKKQAAKERQALAGPATGKGAKASGSEKFSEAIKGETGKSADEHAGGRGRTKPSGKLPEGLAGRVRDKVAAAGSERNRGTTTKNWCQVGTDF